METPKDTVIITLRLPKDLHAKIKADADIAGQKIITWMMRAALARLQASASGERY